ncbi:MAG TPA: protein rep, partial [Polyangiaceae bacterium]|nr:protein rep [Polyangiaceae bacterium]
MQIHAERGGELTRAVAMWGPANVAMLSLTVRHGLGDDLRATRQGIANAFQALIRGEPWKRFCLKYGVDHHVRALEITHGRRHGWHPHIHALLFLQTPLSADELAEATSWLQERWRNCVRRALGSAFAPNDHGVDLRESKCADYLARFSFELVDPGTKRGRGENRTPIQIAASAAEGRHSDDEALWVAYCEAMRGAKMLTWSKGLRAAVELDVEKDD